MSVHAHVAPSSPRVGHAPGPAPAAERAPAPAVVHRAVRGSGEPMDVATRHTMEARFGHDFSRVRVHTGALAEESASAIGARAYTVGSDIVFGRGQFDPTSGRGWQLLAHELSHVLQQPESVGAPREIGGTGDRLEREAEDLSRGWTEQAARPRPSAVSSGVSTVQRAPLGLADRADYPTEEQQRRIQEVVNPQQERARASDAPVPPVTDVPGLRAELTACADQMIDQQLPGARARESSSVRLQPPAVAGLAEVAQREVRRFYAPYLRAATHAPEEAARLADYRLREHLHLMPADLPGEVDDVARGLLRNRMLVSCAQILQDHNVLTGEGQRDEALFLSIRDEVFQARADDVRTLARFNPGVQSGGEVYIQTHLPQAGDRTAEESAVSGRWGILGTTIHEMLHAVAHEEFRRAVAPLEERDIAVEGFAEFFTRPVFDAVVAEAAGNASLRTTVEGSTGPLRPGLIGKRTQYQRYFDAVTRISSEILAGNTENLKVAYFMGRVEYLGLGGWNAAEAGRRAAAGRPAHQLGAAVLMVAGATGTSGGVEFRYTRVSLGRGGDLQLRLGGQVGYLASGSRLSLAGTAAVRYSWPDVYVDVSAAAGASASLGAPLRQSIRLDLLPEVEAGVRLGAWRVGAGMIMLVPLAGGPADERTLRWGARIGLSVDF